MASTCPLFALAEQALRAAGPSGGPGALVWVGLRVGEDLAALQALPAERIVLVAADPAAGPVLEAAAAADPRLVVRLAALAEARGRAPLHVTNMPSLTALRPVTAATAATLPGLREIATPEVATAPLPDLLRLPARASRDGLGGGPEDEPEDGLGLEGSEAGGPDHHGPKHQEPDKDGPKRDGPEDGQARIALLIVDSAGQEAVLQEALVGSAVAAVGQVLLRLPLTPMHDGSLAAEPLLAALQAAGWRLAASAVAEDPAFACHLLTPPSVAPAPPLQAPDSASISDPTSAAASGAMSGLGAPDASDLAAALQRAQRAEARLAQASEDLSLALRMQAILQTDLDDLRARYTTLHTAKTAQDTLLADLLAQLDTAVPQLHALSAALPAALGSAAIPAAAESDAIPAAAESAAPSAVPAAGAFPAVPTGQAVPDTPASKAAAPTLKASGRKKKRRGDDA